MQHIRLRQCSAQDIPELMAVALQSYREHYLYLWTEPRYAEGYMKRSFSAASLRQQMADDQAAFYLVYYQEAITGFIKLNNNRALPGDDPAKSVELERIYLTREASGKGIGSRVIRMVAEQLKEQQKAVLWLKSMDSSPAVRFYEKAGFERIGTERLPFEGFRDEYRNMIVMRLLLSKIP